MDLPDVQIKKILYATDLSESAVYAFAHAVSLATLYGAGITILHVLAEYPGEEFITNLRPQGKIIETSSINAIGVRKDWPELQSILQKAMDTVTRDEMAALEARWFGLMAPGRDEGAPGGDRDGGGAPAEVRGRGPGHEPARAPGDRAGLRLGVRRRAPLLHDEAHQGAHAIGDDLGPRQPSLADDVIPSGRLLP